MTPADLRAKFGALVDDYGHAREQYCWDHSNKYKCQALIESQADLTAFVDLLIEVSDAAIEYYKPSCTCAECRALSRLEELL